MSKTHTPVELKNIDSLSRNASTIQSRSCSNELEVGTKHANCDMKLERSGDDNSDDVSESDKVTNFNSICSLHKFMALILHKLHLFLKV